MTGAKGGRLTSGILISRPGRVVTCVTFCAVTDIDFPKIKSASMPPFNFWSIIAIPPRIPMYPTGVFTVTLLFFEIRPPTKRTTPRAKLSVIAPVFSFGLYINSSITRRLLGPINNEVPSIKIIWALPFSSVSIFSLKYNCAPAIIDRLVLASDLASTFV